MGRMRRHGHRRLVPETHQHVADRVERGPDREGDRREDAQAVLEEARVDRRRPGKRGRDSRPQRVGRHDGSISVGAGAGRPLTAGQGRATRRVHERRPHRRHRRGSGRRERTSATSRPRGPRARTPGPDRRGRPPRPRRPNACAPPVGLTSRGRRRWMRGGHAGPRAVRLRAEDLDNRTVRAGQLVAAFDAIVLPDVALLVDGEVAPAARFEKADSTDRSVGASPL